MPRFDAEVVVMPKPEVADPQGQAIEGALARLGLTGEVQARHIHVGKVFRLDLEASDRAAAEQALHTLADRVLANPNIETFQLKVSSH
ncbi:MAG: phosphoribosylformylglycinamidine synthase subunit PurS [Candidatus Sumerlaeia bacterium]|nr:phosphoribosylformylglycinamidine synthase subunit PurS [Candidatus Sumerlaeia bacterium]